MSRFGINGPDEFLIPFGLLEGKRGSFGNTKRDDEGKEICWQRTDFSGMFEMAEQKPAINFSISWEMGCECISEEYKGDEFDMKRGTQPVCSEFTGKFHERAFDCPAPGILAPYYSDIDESECCTETKCSLTNKEISFEDLMPIPFELLMPDDDLAEKTCEEGWENSDIGGPPNTRQGFGLTRRAQALREFGCSEVGKRAMSPVGKAVYHTGGDSGLKSGGAAGAGTWQYAEVESEAARDQILMVGLNCGQETGATVGAFGSPNENQQNRAEAIMKLCFVLGGAYDTDNDDQEGIVDNGGDSGGVNDGLDGKGWVEKNKPKFDCETCECEDPLLSGVWAPPFDCTDPPCEEPYDWWSH